MKAIKRKNQLEKTTTAKQGGRHEPRGKKLSNQEIERRELIYKLIQRIQEL